MRGPSLLTRLLLSVIVGGLTAAAVTACTPPPPPVKHSQRPVQTDEPPAQPAARHAAAGEPARFAGMADAHNGVRRQVGAGDLQWSDHLAGTAQGWADRLGGENCAMRHSKTAGLGENPHADRGTRQTPADVVASWAREQRFFNPATNTCAPGEVCGHYTQVVWRNTRMVGCGITTCGNKEVWVCDYSPPGNYNRQRPF
ncbi:MAG: SCP-like extracellular [Acetobacteraceae bacterium]|nr:SCP-like extracellular [Acetobacteraceae bacterium]